MFTDDDPVLEGEKAGYISMVGDLMAAGTKNMTKAEIDAAVDYIGANFNVGAGNISGSCLSKHKMKLLDIMADVLYNPSFDKSELEKIKTQTLAGISSGKSNPGAMMANLRRTVYYGEDHPFGEITSEKTVEKITVEDIKTYYDKYFIPNNAYLTFVGDINLEEARSIAEKYFGIWKKGNVISHSYEKPSRPDKAKVSIMHQEGAVQSTISVGYPLDFKPGNKDAIKASVMNAILGNNGLKSYLNQNLREDKGYTYGAGSGLSSSKVIGNFGASSSVRTEVTDSAINEILFELRRIRNERVDPKMLNLVKNSMTGGFARSLQSPSTIGGFALNIARYGLDEDYYEKYLERLNAVSAEDVMEMAKKYIHPEQVNILVVGDKAKIKEKLTPFTAVGKVQEYDYYGNIVEEKEMADLGSVSAEKIISDYLDAIGGREDLEAVKSMKSISKAAIQGQELTLSQFVEVGSKYKEEVSMMGQVMQAKVFKDRKTTVSAMGQKQEMTEEESKGDRANTEIFPELYYKNGYNLKLISIESVEGEEAYKLLVTSPEGDEETKFYGKESKLLLKVVNQISEQGQTATIITLLKDYRDVQGIKMPYSMIVSGMMPVPLEMKVDEMVLNAEIDPSVFDIN